MTGESSFNMPTNKKNACLPSLEDFETPWAIASILAGKNI